MTAAATQICRDWKTYFDRIASFSPKDDVTGDSSADELAIGAGVAISKFDNDSIARIGAGAQINQSADPADQSDEQTVEVLADLTGVYIEAGHASSFNLSLPGISEAIGGTQPRKIGETLREKKLGVLQDIINPLGVSGKSAIGAANVPDGTLLTVAVNLGVVLDDASNSIANQQEGVTGGTFGFTYQAPSVSGSPTFTARALDGSAAGQDGSILEFAGLTARRYDFNGRAEDTQIGFVGVRAAQLYDAELGYGWEASPREFQRGGSAYSVDSVPLYRDGVWGSAGASGARTFMVAVDPGTSSNVRVYVGDRSFRRDRIQVTVEDGTSVMASNTARNQFASVVLLGAQDANNDGVLEVTFSDLGRDPYWVVNGLEISSGALPATAPLTLASAAPSGDALSPAPLSQQQLAGVVAEAIGPWAAAGVAPDDLKQVARLPWQIQDLDSMSYLGLSFDGGVVIDDDAGGWGWHWQTDVAAAPSANDVDLLTTVAHEVGHQLGLADEHRDDENIMYAYLAPGERRIPDTWISGGDIVTELGEAPDRWMGLTAALDDGSHQWLTDLDDAASAASNTLDSGSITDATPPHRGAERRIKLEDGRWRREVDGLFVALDEQPDDAASLLLLDPRQAADETTPPPACRLLVSSRMMNCRNSLLTLSKTLGMMFTMIFGMRNRRCVWPALAWLLLAAGPGTAQDVYRVGVAAVDVTPHYPIRLNGFGNRREESAGVSQRIYAKSIAISREDEAPLVLVTLDSLGIRTPMVDEVARRLADSDQLPPENLAVTFTHSHCTPKVNGASDNIFSSSIPAEHQQHIDQYTKELAGKITQAAQQALRSRSESHLQWGVGKVEFAKNRRTVGGPVDHDLPVLVVRSVKTGEPTAIYVSYACHCVTLSFNQISGDWAGYAAEMIQRRFPSATALVSIGAGSDQNPISGVMGGQVEVAKGQGMLIADEVKRLLDGPLRDVRGAPRAVKRQIPLPLNPPPTREQLQAQTKTGRPTDRYNARTQLARLDRGEELQRQIDYTIQTWTFGDSLCMSFLAGEVCVDYSLRLKAAIDRDRFWLNAYSNDFCSYIPSERLLKEGGYGGGSETPYFALPTTLQAGLEQAIVDEVMRQTPQEFHAPQGTLGISPKSPRDSLAAMRPAEGWTVRLAASEPQVRDPVAIDFGPDGRLWVAEMREYGRDVYEKFAPHSQVRWLRDNDGDGQFETAQTFVDGLRFPTDVKVWRDGVLICDAPRILWARDTDGDGQADQVETLYSGFEIRNAQARVNSLRWGLDGWLYGAGGLFGGKIRSHRTGDVIECSNRDFRIQPDKGLVEAVAGRTQQGRDRNDWGDWFGCSNGALLRAIARPEKNAPAPRLSLQDDALKLYPPDGLVRFALSGAPGSATSACGLGIYRDSRLGAGLQGDAFTCEPVHQLVHRIDLERHGHGFTGGRAQGEERREFLDSTDRWFRPVQARTGPDGALWVVDMYRFVIEHPRWIPQDTLAKLDVFAGSDRGRIYRVAPIGNDRIEAAAGAIPDLQQLSSRQLAAKVGAPNGVVRDLAQQLLQWRAASNDTADEAVGEAVGRASNEAVDEQLRAVLATGKNAAAQIQALATLDTLGRLQAADVRQALSSPSVEVVLAALRVTSRRWRSQLSGDDPPVPSSRLVRLSEYDDARVRRAAVALVAGLASPQATAAWVKRMSLSEPDDVVRQAAVGSVDGANVSRVLPLALDASNMSRADLRQVLDAAVEEGDRSTMSVAVKWLLEHADASQLAAALDALDARAAIEESFVSKDLRGELQMRLRAAVATLRDADANDQAVRDALLLLGRPDGPMTRTLPSTSEQRAALMALRIAAAESAAVQRRAIEAVAATAAPSGPSLLLAKLRSASPAIRQDLLGTLLSRPAGAAGLLQAVEASRLRADMLNATQRQQLLAHPREEIRTLARRVLQSDSDSRRAEVVAALAPALSSPGNVSAGKRVFQKRCATCHKLGDQGHVVGPDLLALTHRDPAWLLSAILDPNKDVDARYLSWTAITADGESASGLLVEESDEAIKLREPGGKERLLPRRELENFQSTQLSLMPEGLEKDMSPADLRDVIAFLADKAPPPKDVPGNQPRLVQPDEQGIVTLAADAAEIRGDEITFEQRFGNVGYWHDRGDSVTWRLELPTPGDFDVYLNLSCDGAAAGNRYQLTGLGPALQDQVASTGGWDRYRQRRIATVTLEAGARTLVVRSAGEIRGALFDLKEVRLVPAGADPRFAMAAVSAAPLPRRPPQIAPFLLDESIPVERREQVIHERPGMGPAIVTRLAADLDGKDLQQEYARIPWIWRVAIAVGKRNDGGEVRDLLEQTVPAEGQPLRHWQAVVIGGGLINGISQLGHSPQQRLNEILTGLPEIERRWPQILQWAAAMADDKEVKPGTRYDALRMAALLPAPVAVQRLRPYLPPEVDRQLQMGAVSGLADVATPAAQTLLADALPRLEGRNRQLALEGLLRSDAGAKRLGERVSGGEITLAPAELDSLRQHPIKSVRDRASLLRPAPEDSDETK